MSHLKISPVSTSQLVDIHDTIGYFLLQQLQH